MKPRLDQWVILVPERSRGRKNPRDLLLKNTPALVSALNQSGAVTVIYPNPLVLSHGFGGEAVKRVTVEVARLRPWQGDATELQRLEAQLMRAVKSRVLKLAASSPTTPGAQAVPEPTRHRSRSREPLEARAQEQEEEAAPLAAETAASEEAAAEEAARLEAEKAAAEGDARLEAEKTAAEEAAQLEADQKASAEDATRPEAEKTASQEVPGTPLRTPPPPSRGTKRRRLSRNSSGTPGSGERSGAGSAPKVVHKLRTPRRAAKSRKQLSGANSTAIAASGRRPWWMDKFTATVSKAFGRSERLPRSAVEGALELSSFSKGEIDQGLRLLDSECKICCVDGLVFLI